jgi:hypothetical protein
MERKPGWYHVKWWADQLWSCGEYTNYGWWAAGFNRPYRRPDVIGPRVKPPEDDSERRQRRVTELKGVLTQLEWTDAGTSGWKYCPMCSGIKPGCRILEGFTEDHKPDCKLAAALKEDYDPTV